jgi:hypothetical protein
MESVGKGLVVLGAGVALVGLCLWLMGGKLHWLGRLPGDVRIGDSVYIPLASSLLVSLLLTLLLNVVVRLLHR